MPIIALLLFGGTAGSTELTDFAFALLIGVASGAYSSIFIASPVLMHWKERESQYRHRRQRIEDELGYVPAYAGGGDIEPTPRRSRRSGRLTELQPEGVSADEFEQMKRDIAEEEREPGRRTSTLTKRLARTAEDDAPAPRTGRPSRPARPARRAESRGGADGEGSSSSSTGGRPSSASGRPSTGGGRSGAGGGRPGTGAGRPGNAEERDGADSPRVRDAADGAGNGPPPPDAGNGPPPPDAGNGPPPPDAGNGAPPPDADVQTPDEVRPAPDIAENDGMAQSPQKRSSKSRSRNRRHGRRR
jgi:hypothetical protein